MLQRLIKYLTVTLFFIVATSLFAQNNPPLPDRIKTKIEKYYGSETIKIISIKKANSGFTIIIKTHSGRDKVVVDQKGNIISIAEYLEDVEPSGGC